MSTNTNTTITVPAHAPPEADMTILAPAILYTSLMMLMGACGNAIVCYVYGFRWQSTVTKVFIFSLALLDLSNSLVCMPTEIVMLVKIVSFDSPAWCKLSRFLTYTLNGSSSLILVSIALDRWYKVCRPMNHFFTVRRAKLTCAGALVLAASVSWPALVLYGNLAVPVAGSDVMGVTCLVSDDFIDSWWPLVFYALYFAMYLVLVVALTVLYSLIAVRIVQLKKRQRARLMSPVAATGLRTSRLCSVSQELVLVEASHHEHHNHHHHNHDNNNGGGGGGKCGVKIQMINEEAELLEEEDLVQSACVEIVPALERIQEENDRRRSVTFRLPRHSGTAEGSMSEEPPGGVLQDESEASQSAIAGDTVDANNSRTDGEKTVDSPVIRRSDAEKTVALCGIPLDRNSDIIQANSSDNAQSPNGLGDSRDSDQNSSAVALGDRARLPSHPKQSHASVRKKAATKGCQNGECVDNGVDGSVDDVVDDVIHDDPETKWTRTNLSVPHHEENRLLSRLSSHSHADSPDEDTDSFEQGIHFVSQSEISWQHNPIAEPVVINHDVTVTDDDDVKGEFSDVKNVVINHDVTMTDDDEVKGEISDVKDVVINHDVSVLKDESADESDELGTSAVWLLGDQNSPAMKPKLSKALSDTAAVSAHKARGSSSPKKKKKAHKTVSESHAWLQVPGVKPTDGGTSSRNSFLLPPGGYPGGHTPTSRLPTPTGSATPDASDNRPVRLSGALLLERLNKKMAYRPAKTTRMLFAISIVFVLSFLPFFCIVITRAVRGKAFLASLTDAGVVLISIFIRSSFLSNAANPIIYGLCNKQFRTECRRLARRVSGKEHGVTLRVIEQTDDALGSENS